MLSSVLGTKKPKHSKKDSNVRWQELFQQIEGIGGPKEIGNIVEMKTQTVSCEIKVLEKEHW